MSKAKAANREGSIRRHPDGKRWIIEISLGYRANGQRRRTRRIVDTHDAALKMRAQLLVQQQQGALTEKRNFTVRTYGLYWAREVKPQVIRPTTAADYEDRLRRYVFPFLGAVPLTELSPRHIEKWMLDLRADGKSANTVNGARRVLNGMCRHAERQELISRNPVRATDPMRREGGRTQVREPWTIEESNRVLQHSLAEPDLDCFLHLMLHMGFRPGEVLGLRWQDIDEMRGVLSVTGTLKDARAIHDDGRGFVRQIRNRPKTKASARSIDLNDAVVAALARQRDHQALQRRVAGDRWKGSADTDYVITSGVGTGVSLTNLRKRYIRFLTRIGVRYIRLHDLRHTVARLALQAEVPLEQVSQTIGHTRIDTTKQVYAGFVPRYTKNFVTVMGSILPPPPSAIPDTVQDIEAIWNAEAPSET